MNKMGVTIQQLPPEELRDLARRIVRNEVYIANATDAVNFSFGMILGMIEWEEGQVEMIGAIYEEWSKAGERSINGYPMFFSCHLLHSDDLKPLIAIVKEMEGALA